MAGVLANLVVKLSGNTGEFTRSLETAEARAGRFSKNAGGHMKAFGKAAGLAALAGAGALAGIGIAAVKMANDFETSFAEVKTLLPDLDAGGIAQLRKGVLDFSKELGIATDQAVPALYQAISAGVPPDNVMEFMRVAAQASIGGATDLATAVDGITSVVNAYGSEVIDAQKAADIMFTGVRLGKTDFESLSKSLFNVIPTAASLGVSFEEVTAALVAMTAQGVPTSVATTQLRQLFVEASKDGTKLDKAIKALAGEGFADLIKGGMTASEVFEDLRGSMPENDFRSLFGSVEAMNAVLQTTGTAGDTLRDAFDQMKDSSGAVDAAFATVADTAGFKMGKAFNSIKVLLIQLGSIILPMVARFLESVIQPALERFGDWFTENRDGIENTLKAILNGAKGLFSTFRSGFEIIFPILRGFVGFILDNKPILIAAMIAVGVAIATALGPVSLAVGAIAGIILAIGFLRDKWDEISGAIARIFRSNWGWLLPGGPFVKALLFLKDHWKAIWDGIKTSFRGVANFIIDTINTIIRAMNRIHVSVPSWVPGIGGKSFGIDIPEIPKFHGGGIVPGSGSTPQLAQVLPGEGVFTPEQMKALGGGPAGQSRNVTVNIINPQIIGDIDLERIIRREVRRGDLSGATA